MRNTSLTVEFFTKGDQAQCPPNPDYPNGVAIDLAGDKPACSVDLTYPAQAIGTWIVRCTLCGASVGCTAAGRPDDPRSVRLPCKTAGEA